MQEQEEPLRRRLTAEQQRRVEEFLAEFDDDAFDLAMASGPLLGHLRAGSRWAYSSALGAYENGVPVVLMTRICSDKRPKDRIEHRLLSGDPQLTVDFPRAI